MDVQEALDEVGGCRRWHVFGFLLLTFGSYAPFTIQQYGIVFTGWAPPHYCKDLPNYLVNASLYQQQCLEPANMSTPSDMQPCSNGWQYESSLYTTLVTEFDLVCTKDYYVEASVIVIVLSANIACVFGSYLTDWFGRKKVHIAAMLITAAFGLAAAFSPNLMMFVILKCIAGGAVGISSHSGATLIFEIFGPKTRTIPGIGLEFIWSICVLFPCLLGYSCKDWRMFQIVGSLAPLVLLPGYCFMFESTIWLHANKRLKEAETIIQKMVKFNGLKQTHSNITLRETENGEHLTVFQNEHNNVLLRSKNGHLDESMVINKLDQTKSSEKTTSVPVKDLFCDSKLRTHLFICMYFLFTCELVYGGLTLGSASFGPNRFINYLLFGLIEFPSTAIAILLVYKFGRRIPEMVYFITAAIPLLIIAVLPQTPGYETTILSLAVTGKFGIISAYSVVYLYVRELFPTTLRASGVSWSFLGGGVGTALSPVAAYLTKKIFWLPNVMFAVVSILAAIAVFPLPETKGKPLPQTTDEVHNVLYGHQRKDKQSR